MGQNNLNNLMIFVADSLRYDHLPDSIASGGQVSRAIAPSTHTTASFSSIVTGLNVKNHNVRGWNDILKNDLETIFDSFPNSEFYDHPEDPMRKILGFENESPKELTEMSEPFIWIERAMDSHIPYGQIKHGNKIPEDAKKGKEYIQSLKKKNLNPRQEYKKGVKSVEKHFWKHVGELKDSNRYENTLTIFTSDHGEILSRWYPDVHNIPPCSELVEVPVVFLAEKNLPSISKCMRSIDVFPTALELMGKNRKNLGDGISRVKKTCPVTGTNQFEDIRTEWECTEEGIETTTPLTVTYHKLRAIGIRLIDALSDL